MLLRQIFQKKVIKIITDKKFLLFLSFVILFITISCRVNKPKKLYKRQYKIIDYILPPKVDSVFTYYLSRSDYKYLKKRMWIEISYDEKKDARVFSLYIDPNKITKKIKFEKINDKYFVDYMPFYLASRTNRIAVINKGKYLIPVVLAIDHKYVGYGIPEYPLSNYSGLHVSLIVYYNYYHEKILEIRLHSKKIYPSQGYEEGDKK